MAELKEIARALSESKELIELFYRDLAQPGVRQVGAAIGTLLGLGNTLLLPVRMLNEKSAEIFRTNMEKFRLSLEGVPETEITEIPPEIGVPVLEHLTYVADRQLSDMYVALLTKAAQKTSSDEAHPAFTQIVENLCPDEAALIGALGPMSINRYSEYAFRFLVMNKVNYLLDPRLLDRADLQFEEYVSPYVENLKRLGLVVTGEFMYIDPADELSLRTRRHHEPKAEADRVELSKMCEMVWTYGEIRFTDFGKFFRHATRPAA